MAAAAIPLVLSAVQVVAPMIPGIISFVEGLFGSGQKKQAAVDLLHAQLNALANAGKIPSAGVVDPSLPAALGDAVQKVFDQVSGGTGKVPLLAPPGSAPVPPSGTAKSMVVSGAGRTLLIVDLG